MKWISFCTILILGCNQMENQKSPTVQQEIPSVKHPEWVKSASIYEVNIRQFTPEGSFKAFERHIPRLKELGVDILWLMPIHPIGLKNRKGTLGSYYAVQDYQKVNPEFGTEAEFRHLINAIHEAGMYVIIDWVANHTAWDNWLVAEHPDWYLHDYKEDFIPPIGWDWSDVIVLDYQNEELREYMKASMNYWVKEFNIDGYRCDVAGYVPIDFWVNLRSELETIKPVFMLAEWDDRLMHLAFDMTYAWELEEAMVEVAQGRADATKINAYIAKQINSTDLHELSMAHTTNHDKNAWEGTVFDRFGKATEMYAVLSYLVEGIPLIYSGQEVGLNRPLAFFEKDQITWGDHPFNALYSRLNKLKADNEALWNGAWGSRMLPLATSAPKQVNVLYRKNEVNRVLGLFNCSPEAVTFSISESLYKGIYKSFKGRTTSVLTAGQKFTLQPWGYEIYTSHQIRDDSQ